jgi:hypothetical protein
VLKCLFLQFTLLILLAAHAPVSHAQRVQIPLALGQEFIESIVREQAFTGNGGRLRLNDDGRGCQYLELRDPSVSISDGRVLLRTRAAARAGRAVGDRCVLALDWHGQLEFIQEPVVDSDRRSIVFQTTSWRALKADGSADNLATTIGRWLDQFLPASLKQTRVSLDEPLDELEAFLSLVVAPGDGGRSATLLKAVTIDTVTASSNRATLTLGLEVPPVVPVPHRSEPVLSSIELAELEQRLDMVDAFFTYTVKNVTRGTGAADTDVLLEVLMELRHELIAILAEQQRREVDPTRTLFVKAWTALTPIMHGAAERQADQQSALRYLGFIGAGDALRALDDLGPAAGIEVSSDGLRRLARILLPDDVGDPLSREDGVDAELRRSMGFGDPLPPPMFYLETSWSDRLIPRAVAASGLNSAMVRKLNNWVPKRGDIEVYLPMVSDVLRHVVAEQLRSRDLDPAYHNVYRWLVSAVAWQESCWRQFVAKNDKRVPVQSGTGDVGMMQINPKVWRGFYDLQGLRWDIVYNARAGADILEHHMLNYAIKNREQERSGAADNLARSAYSAYNGGPRRYDRYRRSDTNARGKMVDALFWEKYRELKRGRELAVTDCYGG